MNDIDVSPNDPVFYLHHCYVDKVWQDFRDNSKSAIECEDDEYKSVMDSSYQNSFVIDGEADVSQWAFIPVTLMYIRPMGQHFGCNPVRNGSIDDNDDIYSNDKSSKLWDYFKPGVDKRRVSDSQSGATKFFVQSDGISYKGRYIDYGIIDTRQMVYETVAYVGVKILGVDLQHLM
ncbi:TYR [Mytilus edulis]|uniref:TYR n=1 Tax=Mytilus edulis TaxID=6550 RepID=A0A8S3PR53_MYTED|nr:TYR [Mytilus edulis]